MEKALRTIVKCLLYNLKGCEFKSLTPSKKYELFHKVPIYAQGKVASGDDDVGFLKMV